MINSTNLARYSVSLVTQGDHRFYTLTLPTDLLGRTCYATTREEDAQTGFQRVLDSKRAQDIADYIDSGLGTIPSSIVLSAQPEAELAIVGGGKTLQFRETSKAFLIIDGQHRVPVVIYNGLSKLQESRLFIDINTKQRPVPNELLLDIKKLADYEDDQEALLGKLFDLFNESNTSPMLGLMSPSSKAKGKISRVTFNHGVRHLLPLISNRSTVGAYEILANYVRALVVAIELGSHSISVVDPTTFRGLMLLFPAVAQRVQELKGKEYSEADFYSVLGPMFERVNVSRLAKTGNSPRTFAQTFEDALKPKFSL